MNNDEDFGLTAKREDNPSVDTSARNYEQVGPVRGVGAVKSIINPQNRGRLAFIAFSGALLAGGLCYAMLSVKPEDASKASVGGVQNGTRITTSKSEGSSDLQKKAAEKYNEDVLPELQKEDPSAHPVVVVDENPYQPKSDLKSPSKMSDVGQQAPQEHQSVRTVQRGSVNQNQQDYRETDKLISGLIELEGSSNQPRAYSVAWNYPQQMDGRSQPGSAAATERTDAESGVERQAGATSAVKCNRVARAGEMFFGTTDIALNSDIGGPAALTIRNGKLRGYQLIGAFERKEEWLRLEFTKLVSPKETIGVSAIGLDVDTTLNAVEGDIDRHLMYRYGWWGFGTILKAVGTASEKNANQNTYMSYGTTVQSTTANASRELKMALGSLGTDIGAIMQDRLKRPITITLNVGDEVGVFFIEDVCSKNNERS